MALKVFLKNVNNSKSKALPVQIRILENKQSTFIPLGIEVEPINFNDLLGKVKPENAEAELLNNRIETVKSKLINIKESLVEGNVKVSAKVLKRIFEKENNSNFIQYINDFIKNLRDNGNYGTYINYRSSVKKFNAFINKSYLDFAEVNSSLIQTFENYLRDELKNSVNTIYNNIKVVRKVVYSAIDDGHIAVADNPFSKYRLEKEDKQKAFLSIAEIAYLEEFTLAKNNPLVNIKFMFLFSCFSGLKLNVVKTLKWNDIVAGEVVFKHLGVNHKVKLINKAIAVLEKYKERKGIVESEAAVFPKYSNVYINKSLKKLALDSGLNKNLTFNMARNTFAILSIKKGVRLDVVAKLLGHKNFYSILPYVHSTTNDMDLAYGVLNEEFS